MAPSKKSLIERLRQLSDDGNDYRLTKVRIKRGHLSAVPAGHVSEGILRTVDYSGMVDIVVGPYPFIGSSKTSAVKKLIPRGAGRWEIETATSVYTLERLELGELPYWGCMDCWTKEGGVFPEGHVCTVHIDVCEMCGHRTTLIPHVDFDWPNNSKRDRKAKVSRD
jgi:hypothetical protein